MDSRPGGVSFRARYSLELGAVAAGYRRASLLTRFQRTFTRSFLDGKAAAL